MKSKLSNSTLWILAVAFLATLSLSTTAQADLIYTGTTTNTTVVNNNNNLGGTTLTAGSPSGLVLATDTTGGSNASGIASTDNIATLLDAFTPGRTIQATDVVTVNFDVAPYTGNLVANGVEIGLAPGTGFRPADHLLYALDDAGALSGPVTAVAAFGGTGGVNDVTGVLETSLIDGYSVELVIDQNGFTYTFSDIIVNDAGMATTQVFSDVFTGTQFIDNIGLQHLYVTHQSNNSDPTATFNNVSIDVTSVVPEPSSLAAFSLCALGLIARRRRR